MSLQDLIRDPSLASSEPVVHAGGDRLDSPVRWVHTSEVLDIASLLRGGELLLVGGSSLAGASPDERRAYVAALADRGVAGLALETGTRLPRIPAEMVEEAQRLDFPLIELHAVVRFVEVTQAINASLVNESVRQLQLADQVSHALAAGLADGLDIDGLLAVLAGVARAEVTLTTPSGEVIGRAGPSGAGTHLAGPTPGGSEQPPSALARSGPPPPPITAPVVSGGVTVALLSLTPVAASDLLLLQAALDRAPEALGLALLRWRPMSAVERDSHELLTLAQRGAGNPRRLQDIARRLGLDGPLSFICVVATVAGTRSPSAALDAVLRRTGRTVVSEVGQDRYVAVLAVPPSGLPLAAARNRVVDELSDAPLPTTLRVAVGPGARDLAGIGRGLREAQATLDLARADGQVVLDALAFGLPRFLATVGRSTLLDGFVEEQLGDLLAADRQRSGQLFDTLATYIRHSGHKTETAAALHVQRQSLYQRLDRIMTLLGNPAPGSARWGAVMIAVELELSRRAAR